jgi:O-antigen ligase
MRFLLIALVGLLALSSIFDWDPGPVTGFKLKNAILYALALGLLLRASVDRNFKIQLPAIQVMFAVLIVYAIASYLAVVFVIRYPHYNVVLNGLNLKGIIDQMLFFVVFFYGVRSERDAVLTLKCLLVAFALSHVIAVLDAVGIAHFGDLEQRSDGRVQGLVGESNQYGAFVAMTLPAILSFALTSRGIQRLLWVGATMITAVTLVMTVSRGAFVATFAAGFCAFILFARYAPPGRLAMVAIASFAGVLLLGAVVVSLGFGHLLYERLVSSTSGDMGSTSSGRTDIWRNALEMMFEHPITLLSGFGWRAYWSMPFRFSPHNNYLNQWFNLGLVGLSSAILQFVLTIRVAKAAVLRATGEARAILMCFIIAALALAFASFFVDLFVPWLYFWAYAGVVMRLAVIIMEESTAPAPVAVAEVPEVRPSAARDAFGWKGHLTRPKPAGPSARHAL